jgi:hypothetical protein
MAQQIGAMVYAGTHQRKTAHLPRKKEIPGDQGPYNEGTGETSVMRYKKAVTKARIQSWQEFVTQEGNKEPWGIVYRTVTGKIRREETASMLLSRNF